MTQEDTLPSEISTLLEGSDNARRQRFWNAVLALAMSQSFEQTQTLLRTADAPPLDARKRRDSVVIFSLKRGLSVPETNDILFDCHENTL